MMTLHDISVATQDSSGYAGYEEVLKSANNAAEVRHVPQC